MITKTNVTLYKCDFCKKYGLSRSNIKKHEQFCFGNPENVPKCFDGGCKHLTSGSHPEDGKYYFCGKLKKGLFTKKQIVLGRKIELYGAIQMPNECQYFEPEYQEPQTFDSNGYPF